MKVNLLVTYWDHLLEQEIFNLENYRQEIQETTLKNLINDYVDVQQVFYKFTGIKIESYEFDGKFIQLELSTPCSTTKISEFCHYYDMVTVCEIDRFVLGIRFQQSK